MPFTPPPQLKSSMFGRMPVGGAKPKGKGGGPAAAGPKGVRIEHRIGIQAPAEAIWDLVYDLAGWSAWNPTYPEVSGQIQIGGELTMTVALPGMKPQTLKGVVLEWVPNEQLHWRATAMAGLLKATRYIEIERLAEESCIVSNGEIMGGLIGPSVARQIGSKVFKGLRLMNEALKEQAEARWKAAG
jgi:hypothetical protein